MQLRREFLPACGIHEKGKRSSFDHFINTYSGEPFSMIRLPISQSRLVWLFRMALLLNIAVITYLALTSVSIKPAQLSSDKMNHCFAFFVLAFCIDYAFPRLRFLLVKIWPLLAYGIAIEIVQRFVSRDASLLDFGADLLGIALYWLPRRYLRRLVTGRDFAAA